MLGHIHTDLHTRLLEGMVGSVHAFIYACLSAGILYLHACSCAFIFVCMLGRKPAYPMHAWMQAYLIAMLEYMPTNLNA